MTSRADKEVVGDAPHRLTLLNPVVGGVLHRLAVCVRGRHGRNERNRERYDDGRPTGATHGLEHQGVAGVPQAIQHGLAMFGAAGFQLQCDFDLVEVQLGAGPHVFDVEHVGT